MDALSGYQLLIAPEDPVQEVQIWVAPAQVASAQVAPDQAALDRPVPARVAVVWGRDRAAASVQAGGRDMAPGQARAVVLQEGSRSDLIRGRLRDCRGTSTV